MARTHGLKRDLGERALDYARLYVQLLEEYAIEVRRVVETRVSEATSLEKSTEVTQEMHAKRCLKDLSDVVMKI